jgi:hypothetical protein
MTLAGPGIYFLIIYKLKYLIINILWISTLQTLTPTFFEPLNNPCVETGCCGIFDCLVSLMLEIRKWNVYVSADPIFLFFSLYRRSSVSVQRARNWFISEHEAVLCCETNTGPAHTPDWAYIDGNYISRYFVAPVIFLFNSITCKIYIKSFVYI